MWLADNSPPLIPLPARVRTPKLSAMRNDIGTSEPPAATLRTPCRASIYVGAFPLLSKAAIAFCIQRLTTTLVELYDYIDIKYDTE